MLYTTNLPFRVTTRTLTAVWILCTAAAGVSGVTPAHAQPGAIYTCTDASGHKITSDRLIASCMDREQRLLSNQGLVLQIIPPELTAAQRAAQQEKDRQAAQAQQRQRDQDRLDRALATRYPTRDAHEAARRTALTQQQKTLDDARRELVSLQSDRDALARQLQSYRQTPDKAPAKLRGDIARNASAIGTQQQIIRAMQAEVDRINAQFDAENQRLEPIWNALTVSTAAP